MHLSARTPLQEHSESEASKYVSAIDKFFSNISVGFLCVTRIKANTPLVEDYSKYFDIPWKMYQGTMPIKKRAFCDRIAVFDKGSVV